MPEHLNHYGHIFGGNLLKWADEYAWIAASLDYPDCEFVTVGIEHVHFKSNVKEGSILEFDINKSKEGNTSVQYEVEVIGKSAGYESTRLIFTTKITFVRIDNYDQKIPLPGK